MDDSKRPESSRRTPGLGAGPDPIGPLLHEATHERAVLVQRRPVGPAMRVLLERERQIRVALLELAQEVGERAEHEAPQSEAFTEKAEGAPLSSEIKPGKKVW